MWKFPRPAVLVPGLVLIALLQPAPAARADDVSALRAALELVAARDWPAARASAEGAIARDIVEWHRLRAGDGDLHDYAAFLKRRPDWPGLALLRSKAEAALERGASAPAVVDWFGTRAPATAQGATALARAQRDAGQTAAANATATRAWRDLSFTAAQESDLLALFPDVLAAAHAARLDRLLWDGDADEAARMLPRVPPGLRALAEARLALRALAPGVDTRLAAVPADLAADPGLAYERFVWRMRKDRYDEAATLILAQGDSTATLGRPDVWADRRAALARARMRDGHAQDAYGIAAGHGLTGGADYADLEFLSGFIALRHLDDPGTALAHFRRLRAAVVTPISLARAAYWEGRASDALGRTDDADAAFAYAAEHQTAFYGLLAAERIGLSLDQSLLNAPAFPDWQNTAFAQSSVLAAARLLLQSSDRTLAKRFFLHLAEGLTPPELGALGDLALALNEPHIAVLIAKEAAERGTILPRAYYPVPSLIPDGLPVSRALALSIARRESEFDPGVISSAGARGLMQVMPDTARMMADKTGRPFTRARLTTDPAYNAALGAAYLAQLIDEFGPSIALVAAGYNAGPGRPRAWITAYGDPRRADVDVVDWIETIPFTETRTYVMRVAESVVIYRALLKGTSGPVRITAELKG